MKTIVKRDIEFLNPASTFVATIVFALMLGIVDWASGYELQFFVFYFIPVAFAAWFCGAGYAYILSLLCAIVWAAADFYAGNPYSHSSYAIWNIIIRLVSFVMIAFTVARIRILLDQERSVSDQLEKTLSEVKALSGLLPICAGCKKIRNDAGYWQQIEEYIEKHSNAQFTHGLCHDCMRKTLREAGIPDDVTEDTIRKNALQSEATGNGTP